MWSIVRQAHNPETNDFQQAQRELLNRYGGAVRRYALAALRNEEAADDVFQEFALRFVRGDFGKANPDKGRFRSFVKTTIYHLIVDQQRKAKKHARATPFRSNTPEPAAPTEEQHGELFTQSWRDDLLARTWTRLEQEQARSGKPYHTALRCRVEFPDLRSPELAEKLSQRLGKPMNAGAARVLLHRARESFAEFLLEEVAHSLPNADRESLQQELIDLNLYEYCRPAFEQRDEE